MKKIFFYILLFFTGNRAHGQSDTSLLYLRYPDVPPFTITKIPDSSKFTKADLQKKKAVLLMVFSPDCDHCQKEVKEITANILLFKDVQIVLVSHLDYHYTKTFYEGYHIANYPEIIMGWDNSYFFSSFFGIKYLPAIFLYNKKGKFVKAFDGDVPVQKIADFL